MEVVFKGSGEVEEGKLGVDDVVCTIASLIDHVRAGLASDSSWLIIGLHSRISIVLKSNDGTQKG